MATRFTSKNICVLCKEKITNMKDERTKIGICTRFQLKYERLLWFNLCFPRKGVFSIVIVSVELSC